MADSDHTIPEEIWRDIPGYEGFYSISNLGRVRRDKAGRGATPGRILKPVMRRDRYRMIILSKSDQNSTFYLHDIVTMAFLGARIEGMQVNHKDGDKGNNSAANLEYCTLQENHRHAARLGLVASGERHSQTMKKLARRGEDNRSSKLTPDAVLLIRKKAASGNYTNQQIAAEYGISESAVRLIRHRKRWTHV